MVTSRTITRPTISDTTGYCVFGEARYGSNGNPDGPPEYETGSSSATSHVSGRITWDPNPVDRFDSGWVPVGLSVDVTKAVNKVHWSVSGRTTLMLVYADGSDGGIQTVRIRAATRAPAEVRWRQVRVRFFRRGRLADEYGPLAGPETGETTAGRLEAEQILEVASQQSDNTKVTVSGQVRLSCAAKVHLGAKDVLGQVFVYRASRDATHTGAVDLRAGLAK